MKLTVLARYRKFRCYFHLVNFHSWSLGVHLDTIGPFIDLHVPFGFFRLGWCYIEVFEGGIASGTGGIPRFSTIVRAMRRKIRLAQFRNME